MLPDIQEKKVNVFKWASLVPAMQETWVRSLVREDPL